MAIEDKIAELEARIAVLEAKVLALEQAMDDAAKPPQQEI